MDADIPLKISTDGNSLLITPLCAAEREKLFKKALSEGNKKYAKMLKKLS